MNVSNSPTGKSVITTIYIRNANIAYFILSLLYTHIVFLSFEYIIVIFLLFITDNTDRDGVMPTDIIFGVISFVILVILISILTICVYLVMKMRKRKKDSAIVESSLDVNSTGDSNPMYQSINTSPLEKNPVLDIPLINPAYEGNNVHNGDRVINSQKNNQTRLG